MRKKFMQSILAVFTILISFTAMSQGNKIGDKKPQNMLCVGGYFTEAEGKAFLDAQKKALQIKRRMGKTGRAH